MSCILIVISILCIHLHLYPLTIHIPPANPVSTSHAGKEKGDQLEGVGVNPGNTAA
jgi:hypothetical protein